MAKLEPKKDTPEGDIFDGKIFMGVAVVTFVVLLVVQLPLVAFIAGGVMFVVGALKYHAGLVGRRRNVQPPS